MSPEIPQGLAARSRAGASAALGGAGASASGASATGAGAKAASTNANSTANSTASGAGARATISTVTTPGGASGANIAGDVGNNSPHHYAALPPYRFHLRQSLLPLVRKETEILYQIQTKLRHPWADYYFAWTANLASHTFYVIMLPASNWFGSASLARDLVYVLGLGIYITGNLKDFLCLPRPRSPPLHRITMSSYTAQEYGFPSSHSANATAVSLLLVDKILKIDGMAPGTKVAVLVAIGFYYLSLIFGRIYCGMHGFFDVFTGSAVGLSLYLFRSKFGAIWDEFFLLNNNFGYFTPAVVWGFYLLLIHIHFEPIDNCPCFDDSVAFIGVLIGLDISHWLAKITLYFQLLSVNPLPNPIIIDYDYDKIGLVNTVLRVVMGITLVVAWQTLSKPIVFTILPPIYKFVGVYLPRRNYTATAFLEKSNRHIRSASLSNVREEELSFLMPEKRDEVGVQTEIDYYEMVDKDESRRDEALALELALELASLKSLDKHGQGLDQGLDLGLFQTGKVFKPRYDVEIIGRLIIYAGVSTMSVWGFALGVSVMNLGVS